MSEVLTTEKRQKGFQRLLKILSIRNLPRQKAVEKLTKPVKAMRKDSGAIRQEDRIYKSSSDASSLIKKIVDSDKYPIEENEGILVREDIEASKVKRGVEAVS